MSFWATPLTKAGQGDPKRKFRFTVQFDGLDLDGSGLLWFAKSVSKPAITITEADHTFLDKKYYFPGRAEWSTVNLTLVATMSKGKSSRALGAVVINQLNGEGTTIESWTLNNPFIKDAKFGELDYTGDELIELSLEIRYDWATCTVFDAEGNEVESFYQLQEKDTE